jgi:carbon-monoxide dehydrogenase medium subunit
LAKAAGAVGNHVVRLRSTLGGCLSWANPRAEMPIIMLAHDAIVRTQHRRFSVRNLMVGPFATCLQSGEAILSVSLPPPPRMVFDEIIPRNSTGRAIVSVACASTSNGGARISLAGLTELPLDGWMLPIGATVSAADVGEAISSLPPSDHFTSLDYRLKAASVLIRRCRDRLEALCASS